MIDRNSIVSPKMSPDILKHLLCYHVFIWGDIVEPKFLLITSNVTTERSKILS